MQLQNESSPELRRPSAAPVPGPSTAEIAATAPGAIKVIRRNGKLTSFDASKISIALTKAFLAVEGGQAAASSRVRATVDALAEQVVHALTRHLSGGGTVHIEDIQDQVELALMRAGEHKIARSYVLYRNERAMERAAEAAKQETAPPPKAVLHVTLDEGAVTPLDEARMHRLAAEACIGLTGVDGEEVVGAAVRDLYDGIPEAELSQALTLAARARIEKEPNYTYVSARLLCDAMRHEALKFLRLAQTRPTFDEMKGLYPEYFRAYIYRAAELELLDPKLCLFDLDRLGEALLPERDLKFDYLGLQTLYDRYFIHSNRVRFELPQAFFMRVAMGLAMNEIDRETRAIEFYTLLSSFDFMSSTPTLFNSGTLRPQLSSCYLTQVPDDLHGIFGAVHDNAMLSKYAGGLGNDWTPVRGMGAYIKGTNGKSNGVVPFLKVANDTAVAVNQCFAPETLVHTANGFKPIKDVHVADLVLGADGEYREVTEHFVYEQKDRMVEVRVKHALEPLRVTAGHPFYAIRGVPLEQSVEHTTAQIGSGKRKAAWIEAGDLKRGDYVAQVMPHEVQPIPGFTPDDARLYGKLLAESTKQGKRIDPQFSHLPRNQTRALIRGLLDGGAHVTRGQHIVFSSRSQTLVEGLRYQLLRLAVPTGGQARTREQQTDYDLHIPAVPEIAALVGVAPLTRRDWFVIGRHLYSRVRTVRDIAVLPQVHDLKVQGVHSYMTTSALVHNGGKRKGALCAYLETWHRDVEEFLDLRKNTGDDRRRTHDIDTSNWVPDLFMKRVMEDGQWSLFSPEDVPDLHDLMGAEFETRYISYEKDADEGRITNTKRLPALQLWRKMLSMLFETGHPWITFKDPCNLRSPQQHVGTVHSSNLCTEITLNTKAGQEIAVCNLGSVNLPAHIVDGKLDEAKLERTINTALRMLDNVIEYNYYSVATARNSNLRHRPVGLGLMGFNDSLSKLRLSYESNDAIRFADESMEAISYYAIKASTDLAAERGAYSSFKGSLWDQGILPIDSIKLLADARGPYLKQDSSQSGRFDWNALRNRVQTFGMRNSNCMAIAPTATIANITGVSQSIEPQFSNLYVKSNLSGEFTVINEYLANDLKALGLWDEVMAHDLKYYDGSVQKIDRVPNELKAIYKCAFEIDPKRLVDAGSRRQKWIDQSQSLNLYMAAPNGRKLDELYKHAWLSGLKTTYYLRTLGATHAEKTTITDGRLNKVGGGDEGLSAKPSSNVISMPATPRSENLLRGDPGRPATDVTGAKVCSILDAGCESCQ